MKLTRKLDKNFSIIDNRVLQIKELSLQAKGLYVIMISLPNDWNFSIKGLATLSANKETATNSVVKELEKFGLLKRNKYQNEKGFFDMEYIIYDYSTKDNPNKLNPRLENPRLENPIQENNQIYKELNNKELNNKELNNITENKFSELFDEFWKEYPKRRTDKQKCKKKFLKFDLNLQKKIIEDVKNRKENDEKWIKGFVPMTSTYLNNQKWEDDIELKEKLKVFYLDELK